MGWLTEMWRPLAAVYIVYNAATMSAIKCYEQHPPQHAAFLSPPSFLFARDLSQREEKRRRRRFASALFDRYDRQRASVVMQGPSYPTETVLSNEITTVLIRYCDYLGTRQKIVTGQ